jgi:hypothetical protein
MGRRFRKPKKLDGSIKLNQSEHVIEGTGTFLRPDRHIEGLRLILPAVAPPGKSLLESWRR